MSDALIEETASAADPGAGPSEPAPIAPLDNGSRSAAVSIIVVAFALVFAWVMSLTLHHCFDRKHDYNTALYSIEARNLVRGGFFPMHAGTYVTAGDFPREQRDFYVGHPPLMTWMLAGWMKLFKASDAAIRAMPLAFTVLNLLLLYLLVRSTLGPLAGLAAMVIAALMPMTAYYSQSVNFEPMVLTFMLAASLAYLWWLKSGKGIALALLLIAISLGCWTDWPMSIFAGVLAVVHYVANRDRRAWRAPVMMLAVPLVMFGLFALWIHWNGGEVGHVILRAELRSVGKPMVPTTQSLTIEKPGFAALAAMFKTPELLKDKFLKWFTVPALLLALAGAAALWRMSREMASGATQLSAIRRVIAVFLGTQLLYTLAFAGGAAAHEYWQYFLTVPIAIYGGSLCVWLTLRGAEPRTLRQGIVDRAAWALAAMIPLLAVGPMLYHLRLRTNSDPLPTVWRLAWVRAIQESTTPKDLLLTNNDKIAYSLAWYADRMIVSEPAKLSTLAGVETEADRSSGRVIFLWDDDGSQALIHDLSKKYADKTFTTPAGLKFFLLRGDPDTDWNPLQIAPVAQGQ